MHPFTQKPNRTLIALSIPVLLSMTAEPLTALIDTAFIASLGSDAAAALGSGTAALSSLFWVFNFLHIGAQTEVAQAEGKGESGKRSQIASLSLTLALGFGIALILFIFPAASWLAALMDTPPESFDKALIYIQIRAFGAPAVLLMAVSFGLLRGIQDMRTPFYIALGVNVLNILLDWALIFGNANFPMLGVAGSALASTISQWLGALAGIWLTAKKLGLARRFSFNEAKNIIKIGGDLFVRTGLLTFFLALSTRAANGISVDAGAAHQAIRQVFLFTGLALDAYASTVQSLVGYFLGQDSLDWAKKVVYVGARWALGTGILLGALMWLGRALVMDFLVPPSAYSLFLPAWAISSLSLPINAVAFLTDGAHWGTADYRFLRNAMIVATIVGVAGIFLVNLESAHALTWLWVVALAWAFTRGTFGWLRVTPGIGKSPFRGAEQNHP